MLLYHDIGLQYHIWSQFDIHWSWFSTADIVFTLSVPPCYFFQANPSVSDKEPISPGEHGFQKKKTKKNPDQVITNFK